MRRERGVEPLATRCMLSSLQALNLYQQISMRSACIMTERNAIASGSLELACMARLGGEGSGEGGWGGGGGSPRIPLANCCMLSSLHALELHQRISLQPACASSKGELHEGPYPGRPASQPQYDICTCHVGYASFCQNALSRLQEFKMHQRMHWQLLASLREDCNIAGGVESCSVSVCMCVYVPRGGGGGGRLWPG